MLAYSTQDLTPRNLHGCPMPGRGSFDSQPCTPQPPPCAQPLRGGRNGTWADASTWLPKGCTQRRRYDVAATADCLRGRVLAFEGDSLTRQIFLRLIWRLRALPVIVEHYFHSGAYYAFEPAGASPRCPRGAAGTAAATDEFAILNNVTEHWRQRHDPHPYFALEDDQIEQLLRSPLLARGGFLLTMRRGKRLTRMAGAVGRYPRAAGNVSVYRHAVANGALAGLIAGGRGRLTIEWPLSKPSGGRGCSGRGCSGRGATNGTSASDVWMSERLSLDEMNRAGGAAHFFGRNKVGFGTLGRLSMEAALRSAGHKQRA